MFTFVRVKYPSMGGRRRWGRAWHTDYPASDMNMSFRLQQLTSLKVNPHPKVVELTDPALFDYPFIYMIEPGAMSLDDVEVASLRRYLLAGGFMMIDDFWGECEWNNFYEEMKRVFPEREPVELDISHPIFSAVFPLKQKPQVPSIHAWCGTGLTYERDDAQTPHYRAWFDDQGRMMAIACHNTDLGDGWEREGEDAEYFRKFAEPQVVSDGYQHHFLRHDSLIRRQPYSGMSERRCHTRMNARRSSSCGRRGRASAPSWARSSSGRPRRSSSC